MMPYNTYSLSEPKKTERLQKWLERTKKEAQKVPASLNINDVINTNADNIIKSQKKYDPSFDNREDIILSITTLFLKGENMIDIKEEYINCCKEMDKRFVILLFVSKTGKVVIWDRHARAHISVDQLSAKYNKKIYQLNEKGKPKEVTFGQAWLARKNSPRAEYQGFAPDKNPSVNYIEDGVSKFNNWEGLTITPKKNNMSLPFRRFIRKNFCNDDEDIYNHLMGFFAHTVQKPWEPCPMIVQITGPQGTGKSFLFHMISRIFPPSSTAELLNPKAVTGRFNSTLAEKVFILLEEAFFTNRKTASAALKGMSTAEKLIVEKKTIDAYSVKNMLNIMILSNVHNAVELDNDDRRFLVLRTKKLKRNRAEMNKYLNEIKRQLLEEEGLQDFLHYALNFDLNIVKNFSEVPFTEYKSENIHEDMNSVDSFIKEIFYHNTWILTERGQSIADINRHKKEGLRTYVTALELWEQYCFYCEKAPDISRNSFSMKIRKSINIQNIIVTHNNKKTRAKMIKDPALELSKFCEKWRLNTKEFLMGGKKLGDANQIQLIEGGKYLDYKNEKVGIS